MKYSSSKSTVVSSASGSPYREYDSCKTCCFATDGHMVMEASDLRMLRPEADQNIVRGIILISVASTKHRVNDMCLLRPFLTLNLVGQGVIRAHKHIPSFVGLPFTFHITFAALST